MPVLALETATDAVGAAVADRGRVLSSAFAVGRRRHAELLGPLVDHACRTAGIVLQDVGLVAVDAGPGLFTGLRVGVAMANGLATSLGCPVLGRSSLEILARAAASCGWLGRVLPVVDARRGEVFAASYTVEPGPGAGRFAAGDEPRLMAPEAMSGLAARMTSNGTGEVLAVGDGARRYAAELSAVPGVRVAGPDLAFPPPAVLARMGETPEPPATGVPVEPLYLRAPDVRIGWVRRGER